MLVATIQMCPIFKDKAKNLARMQALAIEAAEAGAKLIVLPELSTSGYSFMSKEEARPFADVLTEMTDSPTNSLGVMAKVAGQYHCAIVWGCIELDPGTGKLYNSQVFLEEVYDYNSEGGSGSKWYWQSYQKINKWGQDFVWATAGNANPPVIKSDVMDKKVGLLICRDVRDKKNDEWSNFYSKGDADIVAFSSNFGKGGFPAVAWMDFAEENGVWLIVSNRYGVEANNDFGEGGICIISPKGEVTCKGLIWGRDCIVYEDI